MKCRRRPLGSSGSPQGLLVAESVVVVACPFLDTADLGGMIEETVDAESAFALAAKDLDPVALLGVLPKA